MVSWLALQSQAKLGSLCFEPRWIGLPCSFLETTVAHELISLDQISRSAFPLVNYHGSCAILSIAIALFLLDVNDQAYIYSAFPPAAAAGIACIDSAAAQPSVHLIITQFGIWLKLLHQAVLV